jgi:hypothetical protein
MFIKDNEQESNQCCYLLLDLLYYLLTIKVDFETLFVMFVL